MKVEQVVCDECKRIKGESNHWRQIGVLNHAGKIQLTLGAVPQKEIPGFELHDICGDQCFHKHIDRMLGTLVELEPAPQPGVEYTGV